MARRLSLDKRVNVRVTKMRRILHVDTQQTRKKLLIQLEELFRIASNYARGAVKHVVDEEGKARPLTIVERQYYARIAAYTAQIINCVAKGIDERQIDRDLDHLEAMLKKTPHDGSRLEQGDSENAGGPPNKFEGA